MVKNGQKPVNVIKVWPKHFDEFIPKVFASGIVNDEIDTWIQGQKSCFNSIQQEPNNWYVMPVSYRKQIIINDVI